MLFSLEGKTAVVTGGGSGIGKATALVLAAQGATVNIIDINEAQAAATVAEIRAAGGNAVAQVCNVTSQTKVVEVFKSIGSVGILVNSAGVAHIGKVETTTEADLDRVISVNIKGVYNCLYAAVPLMKAAGKGVIVNLASVANNVGVPDRFAYSMSKGAVLGMTLSVAKDYIHDGIRCNCISPARVHTPFVDNFIANNYAGREEETFKKLSATQPIGRMAKPEEVAFG
jgi:2-keto-3-deoxy-L-fuconate dehydrogenase